MNEHTIELVERMVEVVEGERNSYNAMFWKEQPPYGRMYYRGIPKRQENGSVPFDVELDISLWAKILDFSVLDFFHDPEEYLKQQIQMNLHKSKVFRDNTHFTGEITPYPGVMFELTLFGVEPVYHVDRNPWINPEPILKEYDDFDKLQMPDFYKSGLMPKVHEFYDRFQEMVDNKLNVVFPDWLYSPFGIATHLRGLTNLLMDLHINPEWVHKLLRFIVDGRKEWVLARAKFLDKKIDKTRLFNDEVDCPVISPANYRDIILPYELEIEQLHSGIIYFHSCGNLTKLMHEIRKIRSLEMLHIGPWTDMDKAKDVFGDDTVFDICLNPVDDVLKATKEEMKNKLKKICQKFSGNYGFNIRADAFQLMGENFLADHQKILSWCNEARKICRQI
jgi:uroporphyrinogen-III decarboxylase